MVSVLFLVTRNAPLSPPHKLDLKSACALPYKLNAKLHVKLLGYIISE